MQVMSPGSIRHLKYSVCIIIISSVDVDGWPESPAKLRTTIGYQSIKLICQEKIRRRHLFTIHTSLHQGYIGINCYVMGYV